MIIFYWPELVGWNTFFNFVSGLKAFKTFQLSKEQHYINVNVNLL